MILGILVSLVSIILFEALGHWVQHVFHFIKTQEYGFPLGAVACYGCLQFFYLVGFGLHLGLWWTRLWALNVFLVMLWALWSQHKRTFQFLFRWQTSIVLASCVLGILLTHRYASFDIHWIDASSLQGFPLWQEALQYSLRHLNVSFGVWIIFIALWFLGSFVFNVVDHFQIKNPWFCFCLLFAGLFWSSFRSHQLVQMGSMNHWRLLLTSFFLFQFYRYYSQADQVHPFFFPLCILAGLFMSDGFVLISCEILLAFVIYQFKCKEVKIFYHLFEWIFPLVLYFASHLGQRWIPLFFLVLGIYGILLKYRNHNRVYSYLIQLENFFLDYYKLIFFVGLPLAMMLGTLALRFLWPVHPVQYSSFFAYFLKSPMNDYFFIRSNWLEWILSFLRWFGVLIFLWRSNKREEDAWLRTLMIMMVLWFVNPLTMGFLLKLAGLNALSLGFEIVFNPFTDLLCFIAIYELFQWTVFGQWILELILVISVVLGHGLSFLKVPTGLYTSLIEGTKEINR